MSTLNPQRSLNHLPHLLSGLKVFSTFFQYPKYAWTSEERKNHHRHQQKKLQKRTPKNPVQSNENNPAGFFSLQPSALLPTRPQAEIASGMARRQRPGGLAGDPVSSEATSVWSPASAELPKNGIFVQRDFYGLDYCKVNRDRSNSEGFHSQCQSLFHYLKL